MIESWSFNVLFLDQIKSKKKKFTYVVSHSFSYLTSTK